MAEVCYRPNIPKYDRMLIGMEVKIIFRQKTNSIPFNRHHFQHFITLRIMNSFICISLALAG